MQPTIYCCSCNETENSKNFQDLSPELQKSLKKIINREGYLFCNVEIKDLNSSGGSFLGELYEIDIKGETAEGEKEINLFIKQSIQLQRLQFISITEVFLKEEFMYNDLGKLFKYFQDQAKIPEDEQYKMAKSYEETDKNAIILENLIKKGFQTYDRMKVMPLKYTQLAVKELAKFHGLSFVTEIKMPEYFEKNIKSLKHSFKYDDDWKGFIKNICTYTAGLYEGEMKRKIENILPVFIEKFPKFGTTQFTTAKCALTHCDYRTNNILVREQDGEAVEVMPVDYQLMDYGCPLRDFLFFIFAGSDQQFRKNHLNELKELYFETLTKFLKYFDLDVENVYPRKDFDRDYSKWLEYGFFMTIFASVFLFAPEDGYDMTKIVFSEIPIRFNKEIDDRIRGVVDDFVQWGYL